MKLKHEITVSIPEPCSEDWGAMQPVYGGRHCEACAKNVVDFSLMSKGEIAKTLAKGNGKLCGRFRADTLNTTLEYEEEKSSGRFYGWLFRAAVLTGISVPAMAKADNIPVMVAAPADEADKPGALKIKVSGVVKDIETGLPIENATVTVNENVSLISNDKGEYSGIVSVDFGPLTPFRMKATAGFYSTDSVSFAIPSNAKIIAEFNLGKKTMPVNTVYGTLVGRRMGEDVNDKKYTGFKDNRIELEGHPDIVAFPDKFGNYELQLPDSLSGCEVKLVQRDKTGFIKSTLRANLAGTAQKLDFVEYYAEIESNHITMYNGGMIMTSYPITRTYGFSIGGLFSLYGYRDKGGEGVNVRLWTVFMKRSVPLFKGSWFKN